MNLTFNSNINRSLIINKDKKHSRHIFHPNWNMCCLKKKAFRFQNGSWNICWSFPLLLNWHKLNYLLYNCTDKFLLPETAASGTELDLEFMPIHISSHKLLPILQCMYSDNTITPFTFISFVCRKNSTVFWKALECVSLWQ